MTPVSECVSQQLAIDRQRDIPAGFEYLATWTKDALSARLEVLSACARSRRQEADGKGDMLWAMGGADIHYMTQAERAEAHALKLAMPSTAQEMQEAQARIAARVAARKAASEARRSRIL